MSTTDKKERKRKPLAIPLKDDQHTRDPQDDMQGPISSIMQGIKEKVEDNNEETKEEADRRKDENT